jgi:Protein of unknown function (DUF1059)
VESVLQCDCGFEARAEDESDLIAQVQRHAVEAHGMAISSEQALLLGFRAQLGETAWLRRLASETADEPSGDTNQKEERLRRERS